MCGFKRCQSYRMDLGRVLGNTQPLDVKELLKALQLTIEFEGQLSKRYEKMVMISFYIHEFIDCTIEQV